MKKITILVFCLCTIATIKGQDGLQSDSITGSSNVGKPILAKRDYTAIKSMVYNVGFGMPFINSGLLQSNLWNKNTRLAFQLGADYRKQFTTERIINERVVNYPTLFAIGGGVGLSFFRQTAGFDSISEGGKKGNLEISDRDGNKFNPILSYSNVKEQVSLLYLDIPFYLEIGKPSKTKTKVWGKIGVKGSFLLWKDFIGQGTYTSEGYYPEWDVTLYDISVLNFYPKEDCYKENPEGNKLYKLNPFILWGNISAGISIPLSNLEKNILRNTIIRIGFRYDYTLTKISEGSPDNFFPGAKYRIHQSNILGGENGARIGYWGLEVGLLHGL